MTNKADLRLCGGTFFSLFLKSRKPLLSANEYYSGEAEPLAGPIALFALARVMVNDWPSIFSYHSRTIKGNTSEYKLCKNEGGSIFPFYDTDSKAAFTKNIAENYAGPLAQMSKAVAAFIDRQSYVPLNLSSSNVTIENNLRRRMFAFLGSRNSVFREKTIDGYKSDLYIADSDTIVEIKSILSFNRTAQFPTVFSERA